MLTDRFYDNYKYGYLQMTETISKRDVYSYINDFTWATNAYINKLTLHKRAVMSSSKCTKRLAKILPCEVQASSIPDTPVASPPLHTVNVLQGCHHLNGTGLWILHVYHFTVIFTRRTSAHRLKLTPSITCCGSECPRQRIGTPLSLILFTIM